MKKEYFEPTIDIVEINEDILTVSDPQMNYPWSFEDGGFDFE